MKYHVRVAALAVVVVAVLAACLPWRITIEPLPIAEGCADAGNRQDLDATDADAYIEPDVDIDLTEEPMANALYTQARADIISGALDVSSGLEVQLISTLASTGITTFATFDASHTHIASVTEDVGYLVSGKQSIPSLVYSDPGLDGGNMTGEAGWSDATYFPFVSEQGWIHALVIVKGTVPIAWIDVTSVQCTNAPLPVQDIDGNHLEIYWHALGIFDEDTGKVYAPAVCTNETPRAAALDVDLAAPVADFALVAP